jgi:ubiquitin-protein ligase
LMSVRLTRLYADYEKLQRVLQDHPRIRVRTAEGDPPEHYVVEYRVRSLVQKDDQVVPKDDHLVEFMMPRNYPAEPPFCRMLTPAFHPNISPSAVCIADEATVSEPLAELVIRVGRMLAFQVYNTKSPRNGEAAAWVRDNLAQLPTDPVDLVPGLRPADVPVAVGDSHPGAAPSTQAGRAPVPVPVDSQPLTATPPGRAPDWTSGQVPSPAAEGCHNCGQPAVTAELRECVNGHRVCPDCTVPCVACGKNLCVLCSLHRCGECDQPVCPDCVRVCVGCGGSFCRSHLDWMCGLCAACRIRPPGPTQPELLGTEPDGAAAAEPTPAETPAAECEPVVGIPASLPATAEPTPQQQSEAASSQDCGVCGRAAPTTRIRCSTCGEPLCSDCTRVCISCLELFCLRHVDRASGTCRSCQVA